MPPPSSSSSSSEPIRPRGRASCGTPHGWNTTGPGSPASRCSLEARTVQGELEAALRGISGGGRIRVDGAGRTDAGVHASGQVIAFTWTGRRMAGDGAGSGHQGGAAAGCHDRAPAPGGYRVLSRAAQRCDGSTGTPSGTGPGAHLRERYALGVREPLDVPAMDAAAQVLVGRHDFSAFGGKHRQPIRTLYGVRVRRKGRVVTVDVAGDAFLRQMVRSIVAALLRIGHGTGDHGRTWRPRCGRRDRVFAGQVAPPHGLCLGGSSSVSDPRTEYRKGTRMTTRTYTPRASEIERQWFVVDADGETLGRLATRIATAAGGQAQAHLRDPHGHR